MNYIRNHPSLSVEKRTDSNKRDWYEVYLQSVLPDRKNDPILEIGPGLGEGLAYLTDELEYTDVEAVDIDEEVIRRCQKNLNVSVHKCEDLADFLVSNRDRYALVVMFHVLEHIPKPEVLEVLRSVRYSLKKNGKLIIVVPNVACPIVGIDQQYYDFTHETAFSPSSLKQAVLMSGFYSCALDNVWPPEKNFRRQVQKTIQWAYLKSTTVFLRIFYGGRRDVFTHQIRAVCAASNV